MQDMCYRNNQQNTIVYGIKKPKTVYVYVYVAFLTFVWAYVAPGATLMWCFQEI